MVDGSHICLHNCTQVRTTTILLTQQRRGIPSGSISKLKIGEEICTLTCPTNDWKTHQSAEDTDTLLDSVPSDICPSIEQLLQQKQSFIGPRSFAIIAFSAIICIVCINFLLTPQDFSVAHITWNQIQLIVWWKGEMWRISNGLPALEKYLRFV